MTAGALLSFFAPPLMVVEILVAEFLFAGTMPRRRYFRVAFFGYGAASVFIAVWTEIVYSVITDKWYAYGNISGGGVSDSVFNFVFYCAIFAMTIATVFLSFRSNISQVLFVCSGGYAAQHVARNIVNLVTMPEFFSREPYGPFVSLAVEAIVFSALYAVLYFLLIRNHTSELMRNADNLRKVITAFVVVIVCMGMSRITTDIPDRNVLSVIAESVYAVLCCGLIVSSVFDVSRNENMRERMDAMAEVLRSERKQYELSRENIELINIKCHDLKHQISALRKDASEENIAEIEHAIMIYDSAVKTGNDVLDVILTEKKLLCDSRGIQMTCVAHGEMLSFMDRMDVYSLFGNALSNAIESAEKVTDGEKRCVNVIVRKVEDLLVVHVENYYEGHIELEDGLPVTGRNRDYHGYGMRSMRRTAEKYGGELAVSLGGGKFNLDIVIPEPGTAGNGKRGEA